MHIAKTRIIKRLALLAWLALGNLSAGAIDGDIRIHDPSTVIKFNGQFYVFGTGRDISLLASTNGFDWERKRRVFDQIPVSVHAYVPKNDGQSVWAPDNIKLNEQCYLYYAISSWGQYALAVGLLSNPTLNPNSPLCIHGPTEAWSSIPGRVSIATRSTRESANPRRHALALLWFISWPY